jgi:hypothetical protein
LTLSIAIVCRLQSVKKPLQELQILPSCQPSSSSEFCSSAPVIGSFLSISPYEDLATKTLSPFFLRQLNSLSLSSSLRAVCTVQTFQNELSGAALHLFARYYLELDWIVIIFDRFGDHFTHISSLLPHQRLFYFPFTILTKVFPRLYDGSYRSQQVPHPPTPLLILCLSHQTRTFVNFNQERVDGSGSNAQLVQVAPPPPSLTTRRDKRKGTRTLTRGRVISSRGSSSQGSLLCSLWIEMSSSFAQPALLAQISPSRTELSRHVTPKRRHFNQTLGSKLLIRTIISRR